MVIFCAKAFFLRQFTYVALDVSWTVLEKGFVKAHRCGCAHHLVDGRHTRRRHDCPTAGVEWGTTGGIVTVRCLQMGQR